MLSLKTLETHQSKNKQQSVGISFSPIGRQTAVGNRLGRRPQTCTLGMARGLQRGLLQHEKKTFSPPGGKNITILDAPRTVDNVNVTTELSNRRRACEDAIDALDQEHHDLSLKIDNLSLTYKTSTNRLDANHKELRR
jgi:hypothetical protein